jgi:hypothetical protein
VCDRLANNSIDSGSFDVEATDGQDLNATVPFNCTADHTIDGANRQQGTLTCQVSQTDPTDGIWTTDDHCGE